MNAYLKTAALVLAPILATPVAAATFLAPNSGVAANLPALVSNNAVVSVIDFDVSGIFSNDGFGAPINEVFTINIGAGSEVTGIGWDVAIFADTPSWLSEMVVTFSGTDQLGGVDLSVAVGDDFPGAESYSSGGIVDLVGLGLNFTVGPDGLLRLEFWESFVDFPGDWDGIWESGTLSIQYTSAVGPGVIPEPATWGMMIAGFGLVGFAARRRRQVTISA